MADAPNKPDFLTVLGRLQYALKQTNYPILNFKPLQIKCLEYLLKGHDVVGVLPTGFGKSMLFHIMPYLMHLSMLGRRGGRRGKGARFDEKVYPVSGEFDDQYSPGGRGI